MILPTMLLRSCRVSFAVLFLSTLLAIPCAAGSPPIRESGGVDVDSPPTGEWPIFDAAPLARSGSSDALQVHPNALNAPSGVTTDWAQRIDQTWGPSPWSVAQMLATFDTFWNNIDVAFPCFQDLDVDWASLRTTLRAQIQPGISRGRFVAIMNHMALALRESHTTARERYVNFQTALTPGVPLFVVGGWGDNQHFGAGLTPLPDGSLLVYKVASPHPLGLVPGDIVLGYDGVPWKTLFPQLLAAQLPLTGWWWGSSESSFNHSMLMSAGLNWHLFTTIDVVKHATGETMHLPVAPLANATTGPLDCTEQLPVPGVAIPTYVNNGDPVSWGIVSGTSIGYVYVRAWAGDAGTQLYAAVQTLLTQYETTGLIFDFRTNYGGNMFLSYPALELLFASEVPTIGFAQRCGSDHLAMCPSASEAGYTIHGKAAADYAHPIAVLVGPGAVSAGDQVAHLLRFHPRARYFGKSTSTAFNAPIFPSLPIGGFSSAMAFDDAYRVSARGDFLTHNELPVDEPVWLEPDDVARGVDTVVERAIGWILNRAPASTSAQARNASLWPPDHQLEPVVIEGVTDPDGDPVTIVATSIQQDEPVDGNGDGGTCPDAMIVDGVAHVRRERSNGGNGRTYFVSFTARDARGGESQGSVRVFVPHDLGKSVPKQAGTERLQDAAAACEALVLEQVNSSSSVSLARALPARPGTLALEYRLDAGASVEVALYDAAGRRVQMLLEEHQAAGSHRFEWNGEGLRPGVYFARLRANGLMMARSTVVIR